MLRGRQPVPSREAGRPSGRVFLEKVVLLLLENCESLCLQLFSSNFELATAAIGLFFALRIFEVGSWVRGGIEMLGDCPEGKAGRVSEPRVVI